MFVLVHGSHQARVAFLNQVEEAEAAVAVLLGDGNDEPEVAAGEFALGLFVLGEALLHDADAPAQARRLLERDQHQVLEFFLEIGAFLAGGAVAPQTLDLALEFVHAVADLLHLLHQRLDLLRANREFLDQHDGLAAAQPQPLADDLAIRLDRAFFREPLEVLDVVFHQRFERPQVVRHPLENLVLLQVLRLRDLDRAVEGKVAGGHAFERLDDLAQCIIAFENFAAEAAAGYFDLAGERDFLVAGEQRNLAHLREVHANGVVDVAAVAIGVFEGIRFHVRDDYLGEHVLRFLALLGIGFVDDADAVLLEQFEYAFEAVGFGDARAPFRQRRVDLVVSERAGFLTALQQSQKRLVGLPVHPNPSQGLIEP